MKRNQVSIFRWTAVTTALVAMASMTACSKSSSSSNTTTETDNVTLSGTLATTSAYSPAARARHERAARSSNPSAMTALSDLNIYCVTLAIPPTAGTADVSDTGTFSVTIADAAGKKIGCFITNDESAILGTIVFEDSSKKSMDGSNSTSDKLTFNGNASLGTISFDEDTGQAVVPVSQIQMESGTAKVVTSVDASQAFDPTGTWQFAAYDGTVPTGYQTLTQTCGGPQSNGGEGGGDGPCIGMPIYMKRVDGKTDGTDEDRFGLLLWQSQAKFAACGSTIGVDFEKIKFDANIDFTTSDVNDSDFNWTSSINVDGSTVNVTDGWKLDNAKVEWVEGNCGPTTYDGMPVHKCEDPSPDTGEAKYQIGFGGGCFETATGNPVQIQDWGNVNWNGSQYSFNITPAGIRTHSNVGVQYNNKSLTCKNTEVLLDASNEPIMDQSVHFDFNSAQNILRVMYGSCSTAGGNVTQNDSCDCYGTSTEARQLKRLRCYAQAFHESRQYLQGSQTGCFRDVQFNYDTTEPDDFVDNDGLGKAMGMFMANELIYSDTSSATLFNRESHYRGVEVGSSTGRSWVNCRVEQLGTLTLTKVTDTKLLVTYSENVKNASTEQDACEAEFGGDGELKQFIFYLNKAPL